MSEELPSGGRTFESAREMLLAADDAVKAADYLRFRCRSSGLPVQEFIGLIDQAYELREKLTSRIRRTLDAEDLITLDGETNDMRFLTLFPDAKIRPKSRREL